MDLGVRRLSEPETAAAFDFAVPGQPSLGLNATEPVIFQTGANDPGAPTEAQPMQNVDSVAGPPPHPPLRLVREPAGK
jgi:hypothetical protein